MSDKEKTKEAKEKANKEQKEEVKDDAGKNSKDGEKKDDTKKAKKSKTKRRTVVEGNAYIKATFNNTLVTVTERNGDVLAWGTSGSSGFKGTRKATPYAAQVAAEKVAEKAKGFGMERVHIFIQGVGAGREQAIRGLHAGGLNIESLTDTTPIPHNGCRRKKRRRV